MQRSEILSKLGEIIGESSTEEIDWSKVTEDTELESFGFDSLSVLDLLFDIESGFGAQIPAEEILQMSTVGEIVSYIESPPDQG